MSPLFIGIDPGLTGAAALIGDRLLECVDLPTVLRPNGPGAKVARWLDAQRLVEIIRTWSQQYEFAQRATFVCIEQPRPMPSMPAQSSASLFDTVGAIRGVVATRSWHGVFHADPQAWKKVFGLKAGDKEASRNCARRLYPDAAALIARAKDHNRAEALLLAHWMKQEIS